MFKVICVLSEGMKFWKRRTKNITHVFCHHCTFMWGRLFVWIDFLDTCFIHVYRWCMCSSKHFLSLSANKRWSFVCLILVKLTMWATGTGTGTLSWDRNAKARNLWIFEVVTLGKNHTVHLDQLSGCMNVRNNFKLEASLF